MEGPGASGPGPRRSEPAGAELARLIGEATSALARLDAEELELLAARAQAIEPADLRRMLPELEARMRVFAEVLSATDGNLSALERARMREAPGSDQSYADEFAFGADWPRGRVARASAVRMRTGRTA